MKFPWAYPGAKVICIDDEGTLSLKAGREYRIISIHEPPKNCPPHALYCGSVLGVRLAGIICPKQGYAVERFRPAENQVDKMKRQINKNLKVNA